MSRYMTPPPPTALVRRSVGYARRGKSVIVVEWEAFSVSTVFCGNNGVTMPRIYRISDFKEGAGDYPSPIAYEAIYPSLKHWGSLKV